jgi:hypothetical protein
MMKTLRFATLAFTRIGLLSLLSACGKDLGGEAKYPTGADRTATENIYEKPPSIFGGDGLRFGGAKDDDDAKGSSGMALNSYLWRASLDTISFMPLASADPFGGVLITEWYAPPEKPDTRFKLNVFILTRELRSDGVQVKLFEQQKAGGEWQNIAASGGTARKLEDTILTRARQMRVADRSKR